jgi:hypothetical protein
VLGHAGCDGSLQFTTCGVMTADTPPRAKAAWYFLATLHSRLHDMVFVRDETTGNANVRSYAFRERTRLNGAHVIWAPTSTAVTVPAYSLDVGHATASTSVALSDGHTDGVATALTISGGHVSVDVSETPLIVLVDAL